MKEKWFFVCQQCGSRHSKWVGRCQECGEWNCVVEEREIAYSTKREAPSQSLSVPKPISELACETFTRVVSGLEEFDNILGGGLVPGSVILLGGEPGVGKSTLLLQAADHFAAHNKKILYVSGEESASQIALRAARLGIQQSNLFLVTETDLEIILSHVEKFSPDLLIVDSVQTVYSSQLESQPGSVGQLRNNAHQLISLAKSKTIASFLVGHVTKEGAIAGPKVLEHMVDVVLYFEGTSSQNYRLLRSIKNRFGSTNEVAVFEMGSDGMRGVRNPSEFFLSERPQNIPGSVIGGSLEGTRPILVEIQALVSPTSLSIPRRTSIGLDPNRVSLLVAILEKRGGFRLYDQDVYVNIAGGLRLTEPAMDLGVIAALISSHTGKAVPPDCVFFGEVGLGGEVRSIPKAEIRLKEAYRIGLRRAFVPKRVAKETKEKLPIELFPVEHVGELVDIT
ncbi:MAG: DNA repair protein RadA [Deltaproteobacteria bacterium]|nr:DNA repair protein RadA [Deltaproteobacteria bacterium]